jgi:hypothetical protein
MGKNDARAPSSHVAEVAFEVIGRETGWYWPDPPPPGVYCPACGSPLDERPVWRGAEVSRLHDYCDTHDGHVLVSEKFRKFCIANRYDDILFEPATPDGRMFDFRPTRVLTVDRKLARPRIGKRCRRCSHPESAHIGVGLIFRGVTTAIADGFYRSDIAWGAGGKSPTVLVAPVTRDKIKAAGFKGLVYFAIMPPAIEALGLPRKASR